MGKNNSVEKFNGIILWNNSMEISSFLMECLFGIFPKKTVCYHGKISIKSSTVILSDIHVFRL